MTKWSGFRVFASINKMESLFSQLIPEFKVLEQNNEKYYFNYYFKKDEGCRIGISANASKEIINRIKTILANQNLKDQNLKVKNVWRSSENRFNIDNLEEASEKFECYKYYYNDKNEADFDSQDETDEDKILKEKIDLKFKYEGTKYAIKLIEELNINSQTIEVDSNKKEIARRMEQDIPHIRRIDNYRLFHFIINSMFFYKERKKICVDKYGILYDIEKEILDLIKN